MTYQSIGWLVGIWETQPHSEVIVHIAPVMHMLITKALSALCILYNLCCLFNPSFFFPLHSLKCDVMARNKTHKQRFSSKHALADKDKGRQVGGTPKGVKGSVAVNSKERTRQAAEAFRSKKMKAALEQKRLGSVGGVPRVIGVVPANESGNTEGVVQGLCKSLNVEYPGSEDPFTVRSKEKKAAFTFICEKNCNDQDCIDVAKVSDFVVLSLDASQLVQDTIKKIQETRTFEGDETQTVATTWFSDVGLCITDYTRDLIAAINSQGSPSVVVVVQNLHTFSERERQKVLKVHQRYFLSVLHESTKVVSLESESDYSALLRHLQVSKLRSLKWRDQHPYFAVEGGSYDSATKQLTVCGHLRGMPLSATQLVHLTNHGTFQVSQIATWSKDGEREVIDSSEPSAREALQQVQANETLEMDGLPTEDDVAFHQGAEPTRRIRVPAGVSDDQAAWYDTEENVVEADEMDRFPAHDVDNDNAAEADAMSFRTTQTDVDFLKAEDVIRLERMTDEERAQEMHELKEMSEEELWNPDMVDTPINLPARQRFAKYRGLKSFHTGKWDPAENLPPQYAYIYKLQGYTRIRASALQKCEEGPAEVGQFVFVTLEDVPASVWENKGDCLMIASGQLEHEQKWSVLHFQVQRASEHDEPIKSKTPMLAHIGFRKLYVSPLFSDVTAGDRSKFSRFFHETDKFRMATFFGPISYNPCPILLFQVPSLEEQTEGDPLRLACFGAALPPNPDLLLLKRAVLTGRVAVINKKQIVVKYMFFNEADVRWFQPVDLYTKLGRRGKISKPVGTHGLFKAALNDQVMQHDVICMDLFKRVFPKWTTVAFNVSDMQADPENEED